MPDPTPEELRQWREQAVAAGNKEDVAAIDAQLAKVRPMDDWTPVLQMRADLKTAQEQGAPQDVIDSIQAHIDDFDKKMDLAARRREVEQMSGPEQAWEALKGGVKRVGLGAADIAHEIFPLDLPAWHAEGVARRAAERAAFEEKQAPLEATVPGFLGNIAGEAAATAPVAAVAGPAAEVVGGLGRMVPIAGRFVPPATVLSSTLAGAGLGALTAEPGHRAAGAALGGGVGALTGTGQWATEALARPGFKISPAAQRLRDLGVEGMTAGQLAPQSTAAQIEQVAESGPFGAIVKGRRGVLPENLQQRMIQEAYPPGFQSKLPPGSSAWDQIRELHGEFGNRYNTLLDTQPVPKNEIQTDLMKAAYGPSKFALAPSERKVAVNAIIDQAAKLDEVNNMRTLADIKSGLQAEQRLRARTDPAAAKHIGEAVKVVQGHIERAMKADVNPNAYAEYQALNKAYRNFAVLNKAMPPRDTATNATLTPDMVSRALYREMTPQQFARGEGGTLRELAQAGKQVLAEKPGAKTGASLNLLQSIPRVGPLDVGPWLLGMAGKFSTGHPDLMLGQTAPQRVLQYTLAHPVVGGGINQIARPAVLQFLRRGPPGTLPEDENAP